LSKLTHLWRYDFAEFPPFRSAARAVRPAEGNRRRGMVNLGLKRSGEDKQGTSLGNTVLLSFETSWTGMALMSRKLLFCKYRSDTDRGKKGHQPGKGLVRPLTLFDAGTGSRLRWLGVPLRRRRLRCSTGIRAQRGRGLINVRGNSHQRIFSEAPGGGLKKREDLSKTSSKQNPARQKAPAHRRGTITLASSRRVEGGGFEVVKSNREEKGNRNTR